MPTLIFAPSARLDLLDIFDYIARDKPNAAANWIDKIEEKCALIATTPEFGERRTEYGPDIRSSVIGRYVIFYRGQQAGVRGAILGCRKLGQPLEHVLQVSGILAEGPRIRTWINGEAIADLSNHEIYANHSSGMIGLQVHGVKNFTEPQEIAWRNIRITELDTPAAKRVTEPKKQSSAGHASPTADAATGREVISLFDGKTLNGWVTLDDKPVTSDWEVVDGAIHVKIGKDRSGHIKKS